MKYFSLIRHVPIIVAVRSKAWACGRSIAGIAVSNPAGDVNLRLLCLLCVVKVAACVCDELIARSEKSYRVCLIVGDLEKMRRLKPEGWVVAPQTETETVLRKILKSMIITGSGVILIAKEGKRASK